jgi:hypothetical protein
VPPLLKSCGAQTLQLLVPLDNCARHAIAVRLWPPSFGEERFGTPA